MCKFYPHCETKDQFMIHPAVSVCVSVIALARECDFLEVLVTGQSFVVHNQVDVHSYEEGRSTCLYT